jgi:hypothetical protein
MLREQVSGAGAVQPTDTEDELPELVASDSEAEEDEHRSESSEGRSDNSDDTDVIVTAQPLIDWRIMVEAFRRWKRYEYDETSDESDEVISSDDRDGRSAMGSVLGLPMGNDVELLQNAFAAWR